MNQTNKTIRILSIPKMGRLGIPIIRYITSKSAAFHVGRFSKLDNQFTTHIDGGQAMYREWLRSQLESSNSNAFKLIKRIWVTYHDDQKEVVFLVDDECNPPPLHAVMIRDFIMSRGAKL